MERAEAIRQLAIEDDGKLLPEFWDQTQRSYRAGGSLFPSKQDLVDAARYVGLPHTVASALVEVAHQVNSNAALQSMAWYYHVCLFGRPETADGKYVRWDRLEGMLPSLQPALGDRAPLFGLLSLLSGVPALRALHESHAVPIEVVRATFSEIPRWLERQVEFEASYAAGLLAGGVAWLSNHFRGELYQLGRLQFQFDVFPPVVRVYRHRSSGLVAALSEDGVRYHGTGQQASGSGDAGREWQAHLQVTRDEIAGHLVSCGQVDESRTPLPASEWQEILRGGAPVLQVHIPGGGVRMTPESCDAAFDDAAGFFPRCFPEVPVTAYCCDSWLLDRQLADILPPDSNIVRFQQRWHVYPGCLRSDHLLRVAFKAVPKDLSEAPRDSSLRRGILDLLQAGQRLAPVGGMGFILAGEVARGSGACPG